MVLYLKLQTNSDDKLNLNLIHGNLLLKHTFSKNCACKMVTLTWALQGEQLLKEEVHFLDQVKSMETFHGVFSHEMQRVEPIHPTNKSLNIRNLVIDIQKTNL